MHPTVPYRAFMHDSCQDHDAFYDVYACVILRPFQRYLTRLIWLSIVRDMPSFVLLRGGLVFMEFPTNGVVNVEYSTYGVLR